MLNKPVYVMCESFKFVRMYPLNQQDLRDEFKVSFRKLSSRKYVNFIYFYVFTQFYFQYHASTLKKVQDLSEAHPLVDYTNPSLITLLFTDLGILTPSAVSDELIKLYL